MLTPSPDQATKPHPLIQEHNAETEKHHQAKYYNRNARDLPSLKTGRPVYVQLVPKTRNWIPGHIIEKLGPRTYKVKTTMEEFTSEIENS